MVVDALVYHPLLAHYLRYTSTAGGRDKLLRTIQFLAKFVAWHLKQAKYGESTVNPIDTIKKQLGLVRKVLRIGKFIDHLKAAAISNDSKELDVVQRRCAVARQLGYAGYLSLDMLTVLDSLGVHRYEVAKTFEREAHRAWLAGLVFSMMASVYSLYKIRLKKALIDGKEGANALEERAFDSEENHTTLQLVSDICDMMIPITALKFANLDDGIVGLAGTVSSMIGVWMSWKKA